MAVLLAFQVACGVKGDPLPPLRPTELGRGRPTFRRAAEKVEIQHQKDDESFGDDGDKIEDSISPTDPEEGKNHEE